MKLYSFGSRCFFDLQDTDDPEPASRHPNLEMDAFFPFACALGLTRTPAAAVFAVAAAAAAAAAEKMEEEDLQDSGFESTEQEDSGDGNPACE